MDNNNQNPPNSGSSSGPGDFTSAPTASGGSTAWPSSASTTGFGAEPGAMNSQPVTNPPSTNAWDATAANSQQAAISPEATATADFTSAPGSVSSPISEPTTGMNPAVTPTEMPLTAQQAPSPMDTPVAANPFLQPQAGQFGPIDQPAPLPSQTAEIQPPIASTPATENPYMGVTALPSDPTQPLPGSSTAAWEQPQTQTENLQNGQLPSSPSSDMPSNMQPGNIGGTQENVQIHDQVLSPNPQATPLDLSNIQSTLGASPTIEGSVPPATQSTQPTTATSETMTMPTGPIENAPTDLSHLIAGDETQPSQTNGVYTPPVAADQNLPVTPTSPTTSTSEGQNPPPGKNLNLTKVLLVAGIPIILIVAALSAYLILGIGKASPQDSNTSLPIEQTTQPQQAPLTNPPQQIVAPSPTALSQPDAMTTDLAAPSPITSTSPGASLSPAMRAAQQASSPSPTASGVNASPAASASTSLPVN